MSSWASLLKDYQTGVSAFVGFVGVIVTLVFNAWLARRARRQERKHEGEVLRRAIVSEFASIREELKKRLRLFDDGAVSERQNVYLEMDVDGLSQVYRAQLPNLGLLSAREAEMAVDVHVHMRTLPRTIEALLRVAPPDLSHDVPYISPKSSSYSTMRHLHVLLEQKVVAAMIAFEQDPGKETVPSTVSK
jgi:hypothetical protein